jgi:hypothetical protein
LGVESLRRAIKRAHGLPPRSVLLSASHTHWGPGISYRLNFSAGSLSVWYRKRLEDALTSLATEALNNLAPGTITYTALAARIGHNRRLPRGKDILWSPYPAGSYDTHTPALRMERRGAPSDIILVGHACHPTSSGNIDQWTPDYPGAMRDRLQETFGRSSRAMFMMGCGGETKVCHLDPHTGKPMFSRSPEKSRAAGRRLAEAVLKHLRSNRATPLVGRLACRRATGLLTFARPMSRRQIVEMAVDGASSYHLASWARQSLAYPDRRRKFPYEVQTWRIGDELTIVAMEGEVCSPWGPLLRALARTPSAMVIGYANATEAYIPNRRIVREGGYEGASSHKAYFLPAPFTPRVEREVIAVVKKAMLR